jgi:hypothetical protein
MQNTNYEIVSCLYPTDRDYHALLHTNGVASNLAQSVTAADFRVGNGRPEIPENWSDSVDRSAFLSTVNQVTYHFISFNGLPSIAVGAQTSYDV